MPRGEKRPFPNRQLRATEWSIFARSRRRRRRYFSEWQRPMEEIATKNRITRCASAKKKNGAFQENSHIPDI